MYEDLNGLEPFVITYSEYFHEAIQFPNLVKSLWVTFSLRHEI